MDVEDDLVPGIQRFIEARDRIIRFYGDGEVAGEGRAARIQRNGESFA